MKSSPEVLNIYSLQGFQNGFHRLNINQVSQKTREEIAAFLKQQITEMNKLKHCDLCGRLIGREAFPHHVKDCEKKKKGIKRKDPEEDQKEGNDKETQRALHCVYCDCHVIRYADHAKTKKHVKNVEHFEKRKNFRCADDEFARDCVDAIAKSSSSFNAFQDFKPLLEKHCFRSVPSTTTLKRLLRQMVKEQLAEFQKTLRDAKNITIAIDETTENVLGKTFFLDSLY